MRKKSGAFRPTVDNRRVNELVKPDGFPLPRVQDCLDVVAASTLFRSQDLTSGYFQIPLREEDIPKHTSACKLGHYETTRMPFGLSNASGTSQRMMELALHRLQWVTCLVYIDDIIVFGKTFVDHMSRLTEVIERVKRAGSVDGSPGAPSGDFFGECQAITGGVFLADSDTDSESSAAESRHLRNVTASPTTEVIPYLLGTTWTVLQLCPHNSYTATDIAATLRAMKEAVEEIAKNTATTANACSHILDEVKRRGRDVRDRDITKRSRPVKANGY
ncbi:uncharacterized protein LOC128208425 [Mya arenaria]|uniref:uncharacterized protein LOC128208425 n=1 Tax=Mya arenaria TaxID=6604 RepID=UPI0022E7AEA3|nr:uncharacterized protein LOC128208425 [Mya arenaria]